MSSSAQRLLWLCILIVAPALFPSLIYARNLPGEETATDYNWRFDTSLTYSRGDFDTSDDTNTLYWANELTRFFSRGDASLTVPLMWQDSGPGVSAINGRPVNTEGENEDNTTTIFGGGSQTGIGDILLQGRLYLLDEPSEPFNLNALARVKFPTASDDDGLGTGEFDETVGLESRKHLRDDWTLYADAYYTHIGEPTGVDFNDEFSFDAGVGYNFTEKTEATIFYNERTSLVDDRDDPRDITLGVNHALTSNTYIYGNVGIGLSDGSPDESVEGGLAYLF